MTTLTLVLELTNAQATGIAQARTAYNATLPEGATPLTDTEYMVMVDLRAADSYIEQYSGAQPVPPSPVEPVADWEGLKGLALSPFFPDTSIPNPDSLYPIFDRVRNASFTSESTLGDVKRAQDTSTALGFITDAILTVKAEGALAKGLQDLVTKANYQFTTEEKALWNAKTDELGFTDLIHLP